MDLILRDESFSKVRPLVNAVFKCSYGVTGSGNDFSLQIPYERNNDVKLWRYVNYGNTEFGGKILETVIDTAKESITLYGVSFRGAMGNTIATPVNDVVLTGRDSEIITQLFDMTTLKYEVDESFNSVVKSVLIPRGYSLLRAVEKALREFNEKFKLYIEDGKVHLSMSGVETLDSRVDASQTNLVLDNNKMLPNCFFAVGTIQKTYEVNGILYADDENNLVADRYFSGDKAVEVFRQYTNDFESEADFLSTMVDDFYNLRNKDSKTDIAVDLTSGDIGDKVKVSVTAFGVSVLQTITERHINFTDINTEFSYSTGG